MARMFFYVCAGMLMFALSFLLLGATSLYAQSGGPIVGAFADNCNALIIVAANGDVLVRPNQVCANTFNGAPVFAGNFWAGGPTPARRETWGHLKSRYTSSGGTAKSSAGSR